MPSADQRLEVYRQHRAAQEKYVYFLLAAVGAAIALVVAQTQGAKVSWSQMPLAVAVLLWGLSFYFGCKHLAYVESTLFANGELLRVQAGEHPQVGGHVQLMQAASEGIRSAIESNSTWSSRFVRWQFGAFILASVSYVGWHVYEMWLRT